MKFLFGLFFSMNLQAAIPSAAPQYCQSAAELKKIHKFLKAQPDIALSDQQILNLSVQVADHCNGASDRFEKVYRRLSQAGVAIPKTIEVALEFSEKNETQVKLFTESFKLLFLEKNTTSLFMILINGPVLMHLLQKLSKKHWAKILSF